MFNLRFLPLDLPVFDSKQSVIDSFSGDIAFGYWHEEELTERDKSLPFNGPMRFTESAKLKYPQLLEYMTTYWPFEYYVYVKLIRAKRDVEPHVDGNFVDHKGPAGNYNTITQEYLDHQLSTEPCGYRMLINGSRDSLYLCDTYDSSYKRHDWDNLEKRYCQIPNDTDCFLLRTNDSPHGVDRQAGDDNRLLLFAIGRLDIDQHNKLVEKSLARYQGMS